ncbi:MAG TPA: DUF1800 domain-containing protein [Verrucomicrobiae bacterium]|nr:DUF1800 domain-containing protein [Verrucomicrobiae bacterium]
MLQTLAGSKWGYAAAAHLMNRAGFGGTPAEIEQLASVGLERAVARFVDYQGVPDPTPAPEWAVPDPTRAERYRAARQLPPDERRKVFQEEQRQQRQRFLELKAWWLQRMAKGPRPLQEKLVLFWHGHFATSMTKVRDAYLMWRQNELFRRMAMGEWGPFLIEVGKDPAMLVWLDQAQSRKQHPNENFAREVMELFALGEGHYTEKDVTEGARALTGWSYDRLNQEFIERPIWHDTGEKIIFGQRGNFDGADFLRLIVARPQAARFITAKLWNYFAGVEPTPELVTALTAEFRRANDCFKPVLRTMFLSEEFYAPSIVRNQVKSPVQWLVGSVRMLERELPPPLACFALTRNLGQDLFAPPNVKGWDGGLNWITTNTLLARYNEAATLVQGDASAFAGMARGKRPQANPNLERRIQRRLGGVDTEKLFTEQERTDRAAVVTALEKRLLQSKLQPKQEQALNEYLAAQPELTEDSLSNAIRLVMSTPEFQLT